MFLLEWGSEWLLFNANSEICQLDHGDNKFIFNEMMMKYFVLDQHAYWIAISASSLKQQFAGRHVTPLGHIILSQLVFAPSVQCCVLNGEAANDNFIIFGLTRPGLEPTIYRTRSEHDNHYTTAAVRFRWNEWYYVSCRCTIFNCTWWRLF